MIPTNLHIGWAETLVGALVAAGVTDIVVSPGSRSTPLVLAAAARTNVRCTVVVDERSAAFFALGQARASGKPSVLICTSGTAAAHYFPAVIEASTAFVPLVVLSADRPWEDRETGASQTIDQVKMFGRYVRLFVDIGPPDPSPAAFKALTRIAAQSVHAALAPTPGPVHLNVQLRKPLEPAIVNGREAWEDVRDALVARAPTAISLSTAPMVDEPTLDRIADACARASRGVIVAGPLPIATNADREAIFALARTLGFPLLVEHTSQLRFGATNDIPLFASFDVHLRNAAFR
ncbi:MAG: 2-succinyl-5-enolpyruvyl-6-hydroxy-3-cyclohexene-1-carboxylic-acid synthase, partial [Polyangiaceae bacterium]